MARAVVSRKEWHLRARLSRGVVGLQEGQYPLQPLYLTRLGIPFAIVATYPSESTTGKFGGTQIRRAKR